MSKVMTKNKINVIHGKVLSKDIAEYFAGKDYFYNGYHMISWIEKADTPHKCNVDLCPLHRLYFRNKFLTLGSKILMYEEAKKVLKKVLKKTLPDDIVIYILKKCFCGGGAK
jgi:hypothetical protein